MRYLDKLIAELVYNDKVISCNEYIAGEFVDYRTKDKNSLSCRPIYLGDFVEGYKLKEYSTNQNYILELIQMINDKDLFVSMKQLSERWKVEVSSSECCLISVSRESLSEAMTIATIKSYSKGFDILENRLNIESCSFLKDLLNDLWVEDNRQDQISDLDRNDLIREICHFVSYGIKDGTWTQESWIRDVLDS